MKQIFLTLSIALGIASVFQSCVCIDKDEDIPPRGETTRTYDFRDFDELEVGDAIRVNVVSGSAFEVSATGERNDLDDLNIFVQTVNDGPLQRLLEKAPANGHRHYHAGFAGVDFSGAVNARIEDFVNLPSVEIELSGASQCDFEGTGTTLKFDINGASMLNTFGKMSFWMEKLPVPRSSMHSSLKPRSRLWMSPGPAMPGFGSHVCWTSKRAARAMSVTEATRK
jgi:hypothetical protein